MSIDVDVDVDVAALNRDGWMDGCDGFCPLQLQGLTGVPPSSPCVSYISHETRAPIIIGPESCSVAFETPPPIATSLSQIVR